MKRLAIFLLLAGPVQAEYDVDPTCALFMCMYDGHISYTNSTCLKARRKMLERTVTSIVKFWERISPIEEYTSCMYNGPTPPNGQASDPNAQTMMRSYSKLIEQEPDPAHPLRVTIEPGKCEAADRGDVQAVVKKGDCRATLRTYKGYLYGTQLDTILHVDEKTLTMYQEDTMTGVTEIVVDPEGPVPVPAAPVVQELAEAQVEDVIVETTEPVIMQPAAQSSQIGDVNPLADGRSFGNAVNRDDVLYQTLTPENRGSNHSQGNFSIQNGAREYVVEQSIRFDENFIPMYTGKNGFGLCAGSCPTGGQDFADGWSMRPIWRESSNPGHVTLAVYSYASDRNVGTSGGKRYGEHILAADVARGSVYKTRMEVTVNTPGKADGSVRYYVNGQLVINKTGMRLQAQGDPSQGVQGRYEVFFGGNGPEFRPPSPQHIQYSNVNYSWNN